MLSPTWINWPPWGKPCAVHVPLSATPSTLPFLVSSRHKVVPLNLLGRALYKSKRYFPLRLDGVAPAAASGAIAIAAAIDKACVADRILVGMLQAGLRNPELVAFRMVCGGDWLVKAPPQSANAIAWKA